MLTFKIKSEKDLTILALENVLKRFNTHEKERVSKLNRYYMGKNDILNRVKDRYKPNNKVPYLNARQTVDTETSYFMGIPINYESMDKDLMLKVQEMLDSNSQPTIDIELSEVSSIAGISYELLYVNPENQFVESTVLDSENAFVIYDTNFKGNIVAGGYLEHYENPETLEVETRFYLYNSDSVTEYLYAEGVLQFVDQTPHYFKDVPLIPFYNNKYAVGTFEPSIPTIDAMDSLLANTLNDADTFAEDILITPVPKDTMEAIEEAVSTNLNELDDLTGGDVVDNAELAEYRQVIEDLKGLVEQSRDKRQLIVSEGNIPTYLTKGGVNNIETLAILEDKYRRETSSVDITKEFAGRNASGVAIATRMSAMEQVVGKKEGQFRKGLDKRLELIVDYINWRDSTNFDYKEIVYSFKRKMPVSDVDIMKYAKDLVDAGLLSHETALAKSGVVEDPAYEIEKIKAENGNNI